MKLFKNIFFWLSIGLLVVNIIFTSRMKGYQANLDGAQKTFEKNENYLLGTLNSLSSNQGLSFLLRTREMPDISITHPNQERLKLLELMDEGARIVLYFAPTDCDICLENQFATLRDLPEQVKSKVILLGQFEDRRNLRTFKQRYDAGIDLYSVEEPLFPELGGLGIPTVLLVDEDKKVLDVFFQVKEVPELTNQFYDYVINLVDQE